jgi:hypothetical protein
MVVRERAQGLRFIYCIIRLQHQQGVLRYSRERNAACFSSDGAGNGVSWVLTNSTGREGKHMCIRQGVALWASSIHRSVRTLDVVQSMVSDASRGPNMAFNDTIPEINVLSYIHFNKGSLITRLYPQPSSLPHNFPPFPSTSLTTFRISSTHLPGCS